MDDVGGVVLVVEKVTDFLLEVLGMSSGLRFRCVVLMSVVLEESLSFFVDTAVAVVLRLLVVISLLMVRAIAFSWVRRVLEAVEMTRLASGSVDVNDLMDSCVRIVLPTLAEFLICCWRARDAVCCS